MDTHPITTADDPRWQAVLRRDGSADGRFVYAVRTTGIYCRPGCPSRRPAVANVALFDSPAEARAAGFRPCRRCAPDAATALPAQVVAGICRRIEAAMDASGGRMPRLRDLAEASGYSAAHLRRMFLAETGLSPRAWAAATRARRLREGLAAGGPVTGAIFDAGFAATSRVSEVSGEILGMTPSAYAKGGAGEEIRFALGQCALGAILVAESGRGICEIALGDAPEPLLRAFQDRFARARLIGGDAAFEARVATVIAFVEAPGIGLALPLDLRGTAFQERVWQALRQIPPGETASYAEIAHRIDAPGSARAVARACAANVIAVAVPCHRVVRTDGGLSGYRWGVARKADLLARE